MFAETMKKIRRRECEVRTASFFAVNWFNFCRSFCETGEKSDTKFRCLCFRVASSVFVFAMNQSALKLLSAYHDLPFCKLCFRVFPNEPFAKSGHSTPLHFKLLVLDKCMQNRQWLKGQSIVETYWMTWWTAIVSSCSQKMSALVSLA